MDSRTAGRRLTLVTLAWSCALLGLVASGTARASCGAEGCPLVNRGLDGSYGRFGFDVRYQTVTQDKLWNGDHEITVDEAVADAGLGHEIELFTETHSWVGEAHAALTKRLRVSATIPYVQRVHRHEVQHHPGYFIPYEWHYDGIGDAVVLAQWNAFHVGSGTLVMLQGGTKLPTGITEVPEVNGEQPEPAARPGTGSTDWIAGGQIIATMPARTLRPLAFSALAKFNGRGTEDFQVGDELQLGVSTGWSPRSFVTLNAQVNYAAHGADTPGEANAEFAHNGSRSLFVTPGLNLQVAPRISFYGIYQLRVWGETDEPNIVAADHLLMGASYALGF